MTDQWIAEVEEFLKIEADKITFPEKEWEETTESPRLRYNRKAKLWFRRCDRCRYEQACTSAGGTIMRSTMHKCDGVLIIWPQRILGSW